MTRRRTTNRGRVRTRTRRIADHDLAPDHYAGTYVGPSVPKTGYDVTLWLKQKVETDPAFRMPVVRLHTWNETGRANMAAVLGEIRDILLKTSGGR
jgi:hypothetical protein